jgi:chromosome segregation protein
MFLQKLELQGFKSFVDRTHLEFGDGITGVIGPNGCGKTNISDAIRWVLGEQSAKQLRGDSMEDVIFNGCPTRKPVGLAEVHLTFRNDRGILPTEYSEVTISRRVFRSGVSEYFLNKTPCRLRDIRDLFYDTGMGSHAYSVIERSMVDHVLSDNSGHRRFLFEEASGITKYKARKKETLNKLEAVDGDLTRLNDIVFEIERELRSLARQVGKARKYQRLRDRVKDLDLLLTARQVAGLRDRERTAADQWQEEAVRREGAATALDLLEAKLNDQKLALLELERQLSTAQAGLRDREDTRVKAEQQSVLLRERAGGLAARAQEADEECARIQARLADVRGEEQEALSRRAELRAGLESVQLDAEARERSLTELDAELKGHRSAAADHKQLSLDLFSTEAEKLAARERALERKTSIGERLDASRERLDVIEERLAELERISLAGEERRDDLEIELEESRRLLAEAEQAVEAGATALFASDAGAGKLREEQAAAESRLNTLLELKRSFEGVSEGAKALLTGAPVPGVVGVLADVLQVPATYIDALEASLGEASAFVLVESATGRDAALERLRGIPQGRATLVDLSAVAPGTPAPLPEDREIVGRASDLVRCDDKFKPLVDRLLGSVVMVLNRAAAQRLATTGEGGLRFVSLDGEVWERGRVRAGSAASLPGLLHREMEIRDLTGQLAELGMAIDAAGRERQALDARRSELIAARTTAASEVDRRRSAAEQLDRELEAGSRERGWAATEAESRIREITTFVAEMETLDRQLQEAEAELARFQTELDRARSQLVDLDTVVRNIESRRDEAAAEAQSAREQLLRMAREDAECQARWARAEQTRQELETGLSARKGEATEARSRVAELEAEISGIAAGLAGLLASEGEQRERVTELLSRFQALKSEVQTEEELARAKRFEQTELNELLHSLELDRVQVRAELDRTLERLRVEHNLDPAQWTPAAEPEGFDPEQANNDLNEARERLRTVGAVNLLALEDYTKKRERWQFLTRQREDLLQAKAQLLEAIEKINTTASTLFVETFEAVQTHFRDIFKTLFEGGDAELRKIGEDPLECEIEIVAKPRGKFLQSISLMSGGERALTAIALLFALYLVKPSPFCLLDEVDAPLDDANVDRFLRMLRRFSDRTQFVVITHNKRTMEAAPCLYGVTMQELGVSKLVSVQFDGVERSSLVARPEELVEAGT